MFILRSPPAARFGGGRDLEQSILGRLVEPIKRRLVHQRHVLRQPRLRVVEILHSLPSLGVVAGGDRSHEGVDQAGGERPLQVGCLDRDRIRADDLRDALRPRIVHAPGQPLHVRDAVDLFLRVDALRLPRHGEQHDQALRGELPLDRSLRGRPKLARFDITRSKERHHVDAEHRIFVVVERDQDLANLHLSDPHRALDGGRRKQGGVGIDLDREPARGHFAYVLSEGDKVLAMEVVGRIGGGQTPLHLRAGRRGH
jgi:hypothetical protein